MPQETRIVAPGPSDRSVRTADDLVLQVPTDWDLLPPGDAALTRRVKAAGPTWTVQEKKGRKMFSRGVWAPADRIAAIRFKLEAERSTDVYANGERGCLSQHSGLFRVSSRHFDDQSINTGFGH